MPPSGTYRTAVARGGSTGALGAVPIGSFRPHIEGGNWVNACGCRPGGCSCETLSEVILPGPVGRIVSVTIDGTPLDRADYRVYGGARLVRTDGEDWPSCSSMTADTEGVFEVTYYRGAAPNILTRAAAGVLANEFLLNCEGNDCRLPGNITSASRGGESYDFEATDLVEGATGIPEVQAIMRMYNPNGLKAPVIVASPDDYVTAVRTW